MATLDYVDVPAAATRLRAASISGFETNEIRPAPKITTSLPMPSPPPSPSVLRRRASSMSLDSLTSPTLSFLPQLLLSSSLPSNPLGSPGTSTPKPVAKKKGEPTKPTLLSSKDPLSLPITTNNFKRFVAKVGPVFWLQDRIEEILLWKRGWKVTTVWMLAYALLCYFPRLILLIPHISLIAIILATYPYPSAPGSDPLYTSSGSEPAENEALPPPPTEGSIPWQANIQGIQNLMGAFSDAFTLIEPYTYHLSLSPAHFSATRTQGSISTHPSPSSHSPYTPHILTFLIVSFPPLLFLISLPAFPIRQVCLFVGLAPFAVTHPYGRALLPFIGPALRDLTPMVIKKAKVVKGRITAAAKRQQQPQEDVVEDDSKGLLLPVSMMVQRLVDDDRLTDVVWNSELREVELWENERFGGAQDTPSLSSSTSGPSPPQRGWSKQNLKPNERMAWTRGRDGWSGGVEGNGEVSNLTFSLSDGWAFVETEDWRKDLSGDWSGCSADGDGWVYSNDTWQNPRPSPYVAGGGSVTRRRRWVRRVWFDASKAV